MLRNRAKRKYGTVAQEIQFSEFYRTAIILKPFLFDYISVWESSFCQHAFRLNDYSLHWWWNHTIMTRSALSSKASVALSCFSFIWDALIRWERKGGERYFAGKGEIIRRRRPTRRKKLYFCMALRVCGKTEHCRCSIGIQTSRGYQRNWCLHLKTNE